MKLIISVYYKRLADIRRYGLTHTVSLVCRANRDLSDVCPLVNIVPAA